MKPLLVFPFSPLFSSPESSGAETAPLMEFCHLDLGQILSLRSPCLVCCKLVAHVPSPLQAAECCSCSFNYLAGAGRNWISWFVVIPHKYSLLFLCLKPPHACCLLWQELRPKSLDIKQEELGDMVEKEMASTSEAIEDAVRRIEVRQSCRMGHSGALGWQSVHHSSTFLTPAWHPTLSLVFPNRR